jgi:hypothetical protein
MEKSQKKFASDSKANDGSAAVSDAKTKKEVIQSQPALLD